MIDSRGSGTPGTGDAPLYIAMTSDMGRTPEDLARPLSGLGVGIKIGLELFAAEGPDLVRRLSGMGFPVFLDLKFHDIPHTVAGAVRAACTLGPSILNVHASGGRAMMRAAAEAASGTGVRVIAVTVLTSLSSDDLGEIGYGGDPSGLALRMAALAGESGLDGVVCSPLEAAGVRKSRGPGFMVVTPGIRPAGSAPGDQQRFSTPADAVRAGADALVVGRPVTASPDPRSAAIAILDEIARARQ